MESIKLKQSRYTFLFFGLVLMGLSVLYIISSYDLLMKNSSSITFLIIPITVSFSIIWGSYNSAVGASLKHLFSIKRFLLTLFLPLIAVIVISSFHLAFAFYLVAFYMLILGMYQLFSFIKSNKHVNPRLDVDPERISLIGPLTTISLKWSDIEEFRAVKNDSRVFSVIIVPKDDSVLKSQMNFIQKSNCFVYNKVFILIPFCTLDIPKDEAYLILKSAYECYKG